MLNRAEHTLFLLYRVLWDTGEVDCLCPGLPAEQLDLVCWLMATAAGTDSVKIELLSWREIIGNQEV